MMKKINSEKRLTKNENSNDNDNYDEQNGNDDYNKTVIKYKFA